MSISEHFLKQTVTFSLLVIEKLVKQLGKTVKEELTASEFHTLLSVNYFGEMTMTAFADKFGIKKQQATRIINHLVRKGYIRRDYDDSDRRIVLIQLTPEAKSYLKDYTIKTTELIGDSLGGFSESERKEFQNAMETMNKLLPKMAVVK